METAIERILDLSGKTVGQYELENYWRSEDRKVFSQRLAIQPIQDWQEIDDTRALQLIDAINSDPCNEPVIDRNIEALAKQYGKTEDQLMEIIELPAADAIAALKTDTRTIL